MSGSKTALALRWSGRMVAVVVFLLWGAFFVEHTIEWFVQPFPQTPPPVVWVGQAVHLALLLGLLALWRWEVVGSVVVLACAFAFFLKVAGSNFLLFFAITALPAILVLASHWLALHRPRATAV